MILTIRITVVILNWCVHRRDTITENTFLLFLFLFSASGFYILKLHANNFTHRAASGKPCWWVPSSCNFLGRCSLHASSKQAMSRLWLSSAIKILTFTTHITYSYCNIYSTPRWVLNATNTTGKVNIAMHERCRHWQFSVSYKKCISNS